MARLEAQSVGFDFPRLRRRQPASHATLTATQSPNAPTNAPNTTTDQCLEGEGDLVVGISTLP
eukprot:7149759-Pyramimonas_sp.AAC.1